MTYENAVAVERVKFDPSALRAEIHRNLRALVTGENVPIPLPNTSAKTKAEMMVSEVVSAGVTVAIARNAEAARRILRIEIDREAEYEVSYWLNVKSGSMGPDQFEGIDLYLVDCLPAPGWRVINPYMPQKVQTDAA